MRVLFFGLPLGALLLHADGHSIELAVLAPFEAPGRRRLYRALGPERVIEAAALAPARITALSPDLIVSWFWSRRIPQSWLRAARLGAIGAHPSLLPRHRGPNPFFWCIDAGELETGVSVHRLTERYDEGDVLAQRRAPIGERDSWQLARALDRPSLALLREVVAAFARGDVPPGQAQDERLATWAPEPEGDRTKVDWSWPTERALRRIRAIAPVPGVALEICGLELFLTRAKAAEEYPEALEPGEAAALGDPPSAVVIRTGDGAIQVVRAVLPDGAALAPEALAQLVASQTRAV